MLDEGDGIPPGDLEHIFDKFYRAQKGDHVRAGTGLGLAISRGFVEAMQGTITAANRTDRSGAVFTIRLPVPPASEATGHRRMSAAPLKVLVIDDEPPIRKLLRMGLTTQGYEILEAPNGKTALELLAQKPDLIILDLGLPDMQGHELLRMIRARNESVPIVVLSSRGDEAGKVQALDLGADDYVTKPFGMDELLARMRAALRHQLQVHGERPIFRVGELSVDLVRRIVKVGDQEVKLSPKEYELLRVLVQHAGKVLTHKFLLGELWDEPDRCAISARLCAPAAAEDRGRSRAPAIHPDRDRHRLSPAGAGLIAVAGHRPAATRNRTMLACAVGRAAQGQYDRREEQRDNVIDRDGGCRRVLSRQRVRSGIGLRASQARSGAVGHGAGLVSGRPGEADARALRRRDQCQGRRERAEAAARGVRRRRRRQRGAHLRHPPDRGGQGRRHGRRHHDRRDAWP